MTEAIFGMIGILLGLLLSEYFRRRRRIEEYAKDVFLQRLQIYEKLYSKIHKARQLAPQIMESDELTASERKSIWSNIVLEIANYTDEKALWISHELTVHCMLTMIGVDDIYYIDDENEQQREIKKYNENSGKIIELIKKEAGLEKIDKHLGVVTKSDIDSDYIRLFQNMKDKYDEYFSG